MPPISKICHLARVGLIAHLLFFLPSPTSAYDFTYIHQPLEEQAGQIFEILLDVEFYDVDVGMAIPYLGVLLPSTWGTQDSIPFSGLPSGYFIYSDSLTTVMEKEYVNPPDGYSWWVGSDVDSLVIETEGIMKIVINISTSEQEGRYFIQYILGDEEQGLYGKLTNRNPICLSVSSIDLFVPLNGHGLEFIASATRGVSLVDIDNDEYADLYISRNREKNLLYMNNRDGTFSRIEDNIITQDSTQSMSISWGDYDNDGLVDLYATNEWSGANHLYHNEGGGSFSEITGSPIVTGWSNTEGCSWGDYDQDGLIDMYVSNLSDNLLYHNDGGGTFSSITNVNVVDEPHNSRGCYWIDYNSDTYLDLYVAQNRDHNLLYRNNGDNTFSRIMNDPVVLDSSTTEGCTWGDYNNDGFLDVFLSNNSHERNRLYAGSESGSFTEVLDMDAVETYRSTQTCNFSDFDNDGDLDLFVGAFESGSGHEYYINTGYPDYALISDTTQYALSDTTEGWGCSVGDVNNDGAMDLYIVNTLHGPASSMLINTGNTNNWVRFRCVGESSNRSALGTILRLITTINSQRTLQTRLIEGQTGYLSQNSLDVHFGLGDAESIEELLVYWPLGSVDTLFNVQSNHLYTVTEGGMITSVYSSGISSPDNFTLLNFPNPFNPTTTISYTLPSRSVVTLTVYDITGRTITTVMDKHQPAGTYSVQWNGTDDSGNPVSTGVYLCRLQARDYSKTIKMVYLK